MRNRDARIEYTSARSNARASIAVEVGQALPNPDDLTRFLTERYRLYTLRRGRLAFAEVEHGAWPLHHARIVHLKETVRSAAGLDSGDAPSLVHWSPGVAVRVGWPRPA